MTLAESLGYPEDSKLLIIHADDAGLSCSQNRATRSVLISGSVNSYSLMVPCPWFYDMAQFTKSNPHFDYGIHLTFTCEWETYKFGPVLSPGEVPSLVDGNGHFFKDRKTFSEKAELKDLHKEMVAQIDTLLSYGLKPSHIDCHMYTVAERPEFLNLYIETGRSYEIPVLLNHDLIQQFSTHDHSKNVSEPEFYFDQVYLGNWDVFSKGKLEAYYESVLQNLSAGVNILLLHPAFDDPEMKEITINHPNFGSAWRQIDHDYFKSDPCKSVLSESQIKLITWRDIQNYKYPSKKN